VLSAAPPKEGPPPAVAAALNTIVAPSKTGHAARFWTGTDRGPDGKPRVMLLWESLPQASGARSGEAAALVHVTATGPEGNMIFRGPAKPAAAADPAGATSASVTFPAAPGQIDLRLVVENASGQVVDSTTQSLTVPDFSTTQVSFGTPRVYRARTAREALVVRNNVDAPPTATREFSRGERLLVRVDAYAQDNSKPEVTARLLNRTGASMADVPITAVEGKPYLIDFPLASLGAGEYVIELTAKTPSGSAQQLVGFKVGT
jgi:hypothetical protein